MPGEKVQCVLMAVLALVGILLIAVRMWGMRFSGFLLLGAAALLALELWLDRWARWSKAGWWWRLAFRAAAGLVLVPLVLIEGVVIAEGHRQPVEKTPDAVIVLGAGVNGTAPSLSLKTRLDAALSYLEAHPDIPVVLTGGQGYGEEITEAACMYDYLTERGVEPERLILEEAASNTAENFAFSAPLLEAVGVNVGTDPVAWSPTTSTSPAPGLIAAKKGYGATYGVGAPIPWPHLEVNYYLREAFAVVKSVLFD